LLDIPITIMGHNEQYSNKVSLYSFVDSENRVKGDNYSIASMSAGGCNRDGASIEFCCQHLEKRKEDKKIFFIISDGQPSGTGYSGLEACKDCAEIAEKYRKKGFTFIATAIGNDKERIKAIYGSENFLDISDLSQMAGRLTKIIRKNFLN
ncbi:MAG: nitric oxide reductase activation protein NorD, partial [Ruminococcus sp.]